MIRKVFSSVWALMPLAVSMVSLGSAWAGTPGTIAKFDDLGNPTADSVITEDPSTDKVRILDRNLSIEGDVPVFNGAGILLFNRAGGNTNRWALGTGGCCVAPDSFSIGDSSDYRMVINSNGNVGIGTPSPAQKLHVVGGGWAGVVGQSSSNIGVVGNSTDSIGVEASTNSPSNPGLRAVSAGVSPNNPAMLVFGRSGTTGKLLIDSNTPEFVIPYSFEINNNTGNGRGRSYGWDTFSSRRWKTNIQPIRGALEKVERLRGVSFDWKKRGRHDIGLIAEEVGEVVPEVVTYEKNGKDALGVEYARLTALLIEATKEQQSQIRELKAELMGLKTLEQPTAGLREKDAEIADLKARLDTLEGMVKSVAYVTTWSERTE